MENSECGCRKPLENTEEDQKENKDCGEKSIDLSPTDIQEDDKGCRCVTKSIDDSFVDEKAKSQCGCGDIEYPDESDICNPNNPKFIADKDFIKELENYAHNIGIRNIGYTQITPELLIKENLFNILIPSC